MSPDSSSSQRSLDSRPRLASKVRLQWNVPRKQALLLYPEGALVLNATAQAVLELCDGRRTLEQIVRELAARYDASGGEGAAARRVPLSTDPGTDAADTAQPLPAEQSTAPPAAPPGTAGSVGERLRTVERDVVAFLQRLDRRGWLEDEGAGR